VEFKDECKYGLYDPYDATVTVQFVRDLDVDDDSFYIYSVWLSIMYEEDSSISMEETTNYQYQNKAIEAISKPDERAKLQKKNQSKSS
jgi:hypothetical protein